MNLAIEIHHKEENIFCCLVDKEIKEFSKIIITSDDLESIRSSQWYALLKACDNKSVLDNCTDNQIITALYFYLNSNPSSESLMKQWFLDTGCSDEKALELSNMVYTARIIRLHEEVEINLKMLNLTKEKNGLSHEPISININGILETMRSDKHVLWCFDSISKFKSDDITIIDLSFLTETKIALEDHHSIIIGFSVDYTTFLEFIAGENEELLRKLSNYAELGLRDKLSVGSVLTAQPQIIEDVLKKCCSGISFHGINSDGKLTSYIDNPDLRKLRYYHKYGEYKLMPLFIKFHKYPKDLHLNK